MPPALGLSNAPMDRAIGRCAQAPAAAGSSACRGCLEQAETWMFRRWTGHESLIPDFPTSDGESTTVFARMSAFEGQFKRPLPTAGMLHLGP